MKFKMSSYSTQIPKKSSDTNTNRHKIYTQMSRVCVAYAHTHTHNSYKHSPLKQSTFFATYCTHEVDIEGVFKLWHY